MKTFLLLAALVGAALAHDSDDFYTTANDNLNIQEVVDDPKKMQSYVDCFLDRTSCDSVPASYKSHLAEAIKHVCSKCNHAQKHLALVFMTALKDKMPNEYNNFLQKYDPSGENVQKLMEKLKSNP